MDRHTRKFWPLPDRNAAGMSERRCDQPGCGQAGEFRAPKSRETLQDYYWFCLDHVRAYNASWDYYAGMDQDEIERVVRADTTWQRPTWPLGRMGSGGFRFDPERVKDPFEVFDKEMWQKAPDRDTPATPEQAAMQVMNLRLPLTLDALRARYRELCKLHHPDANGGDKAAEERFKQISQAYKTLRESLDLT